jgi:hypothetical protein
VLIRGLAGALSLYKFLIPGSSLGCYQLRRQGDKFRGAVAADSDFSLRARFRDKLFFPRVMLITSESGIIKQLRLLLWPDIIRTPEARYTRAVYANEKSGDRALDPKLMFLRGGVGDQQQTFIYTRLATFATLTG